MTGVMFTRERDDTPIRPVLPAADATGNYPAVAYARASLARKLVQRRHALGLTQRALAKRVGIPFESLCRIERGAQSPNIRTVDKIVRALAAAEAARAKRNR